MTFRAAGNFIDLVLEHYGGRPQQLQLSVQAEE